MKTNPHNIPTTIERDAARRAGFANGAEFHRIQKFAAACRQQWPGARIVLRANEDQQEQENATKENDERRQKSKTTHIENRSASMTDHLMDPFREMAAALRTKSGFGGVPRMKFTKGLWLAGAADVSMNGAELLAHPDQAMFGWCMWQNKKPVDYYVGRVADRYQPPKRSQLGNNDPAKWEKKDSDPWQLTFYLPLTDLGNGALYVYSTTSGGGRDALANLQEAYADNRQFHPQDAHKLPLVKLEREHYQRPEFGRVEKPIFEIVRWVDPPPDMKAVHPPAPASSMLALEHSAADSNDKFSENPADGLDGEIPF